MMLQTSRYRGGLGRMGTREILSSELTINKHSDVSTSSGIPNRYNMYYKERMQQVAMKPAIIAVPLQSPEDQTQNQR